MININTFITIIWITCMFFSSLYLLHLCFKKILFNLKELNKPKRRLK